MNVPYAWYSTKIDIKIWNDISSKRCFWPVICKTFHFFIHLFTQLFDQIYLSFKVIGVCHKVKTVTCFIVSSLNNITRFFSVLIHNTWEEIKRSFKDLSRSQRNFKHWEADRTSANTLNVRPWKSSRMIIACALLHIYDKLRLWEKPACP